MSQFETPGEGFAWIESLTNLERGTHETREYRLDRMQRLFDFWDNPQLKLPTVHGAGSKGKGSTLTCLADGLAAMGYSPGLYRSPHVLDYRERITVAQTWLDDRIYLARLNEIHSAIEGGSVLEAGDAPTSFELLTLLAFLCFLDAGCDIVVVETGLGGRLDATNLVKPVLSIITSIELEHTEYLGTELEKIAAEKAGICKPGVPVLSFPQTATVRRVLRDRAASVGAQLLFPLGRSGLSRIRLRRERDMTVVLSGKGLPEIRTRTLPGRLAANAAFALAAIGFLVGRGLVAGSLEDAAVAISDTSISGRMQILNDPQAPGLRWVLDGAHTKASFEAVLGTLRAMGVRGRGYTVVFGLTAGRDAAPLFRVLRRFASRILVTGTGSFKPGNIEQQASDAASFFGERAELLPLPEDAVRRARAIWKSEGTSPVLVVGSFYLVGAVLPHIVLQRAGSQ